MPAYIYVAINVAASLLALGIIQHNQWFGSRLTQVLMAGISAMAFFRTSLFVVRAGDRDVGIGPSGFIQIYLSAADRAVDRARAAARATAVDEIMKDVDYARGFQMLPMYWLARPDSIILRSSAVLMISWSAFSQDS